MMRDIFEQQVQVGVEKQPSNEDENYIKCYRKIRNYKQQMVSSVNQKLKR